ncbi:carboxypeptidase-like regulatory domain-containing protein [Geobacter pickeringii]|uniref:carboxypeptidase-like regulatory domain-containing protein n=1 Tax=Geobacter pickeringii TaxID=345632 RepID=UPI000AB7136C|nr:carboxypeptidase-like regulatory domain-containing protein [Geobacter pickeringii]
MIGFFLMVFLGSVPFGFAGEGTGIITGKWITNQYGPMTGGQVLLFDAAKGPAPASKKYLRLPDAGTAIDNDGKFSAEVPAGRYYLVMRRRGDQTSAGPPVEGEPQYYARMKNGEPRLYTVKSGKTTNIGTIAEVYPYRREKTVVQEGMTGIEGAIVDEQGKPVAGVRVFAYEFAGMQGMPRYASDETGADGKYVLLLTRKGAYFLKARTHYGGGKPQEGEFMGTYGPRGAPGPVAVENGKMSRGIDIQVTRFKQQRGSP